MVTLVVEAAFIQDNGFAVAGVANRWALGVAVLMVAVEEEMDDIVVETADGRLWVEEDLRGDHSGYHSGFRSLRKVVASWMELNFLQVLPLPCDALNALPSPNQVV